MSLQPGSPTSEKSKASLRWWVEILLTLGFYTVYSAVRNQFGSALGDSAIQPAYANAVHVINFERAVGLYHEEWIQARFIGWDNFIVFWNVFYGSFHFFVTIGVMVYLFRRFPARYAFMRATLCAATSVALIGFAFFPLMPPRLLGNCVSQYGACKSGHVYIDTLVSPGGLWSFESGTMSTISNQFAAMPSLHIAWSTWCAIGLLPVLTHRWSRIAIVLYPLLTMFAIVVTANHFWIDALGGLAALGVALKIAPRLTRILPGPTGNLHSDVARRPLRT